MTNKTIFREIFGDSPQIKVIDFLIGDIKESWTLYEIRDKTKTSYATLKKLMPSLLDKKIVAIRKRVGKSSLYALNLKNRYIKRLADIDLELLK